MENMITTFKNTQFGDIRIIRDEDRTPWFIGTDIAKVLGYTNYRNAIVNHVDDEDKQRTQIEYAGQRREVTVINESGLYSLVLSSRLPQAREFKRWVTTEVLPSIRKDGGYILTNEEDTPETIMARAVLIANQTISRLQKENKVLGLKARHLDDVVLCHDCYTTTQIAKDLGITVHELTSILLAKNIIYHQSGQYMLYADYAHLGLAKNRTAEKRMEDGSIKTFPPYLVWTEKGRIFINNLVRLNPTKVNIRTVMDWIQPTLF